MNWRGGLLLRWVKTDSKNMNVRAVIVFLFFIIWVQISWRWYTCGIKGFYKAALVETSQVTSETQSLDVLSGMDDSPIRSFKNSILFFFPYKVVTQDFEQQISPHLDDLAMKLKKTGNNIRITGHTDTKGSASYNHGLGLKRANMIAKALERRGVPIEQVEIYSRGESQPLSDTDNEQQTQNRRVEIEFLNNK